ncbi:MAG: transglycosylase domain-containing protein, partial [Pseudomonadota bacterium]
MASVSAVVVWTFEVKLQRWPIAIFGAPTIIKIGDKLTDLQLYSRLTRLGYSEGGPISLFPGEWTQSESNLRIVLRYSPFMDQGVIDGPIALTLDGDTIKSIRLMRSMQEVKNFDLEPELVGVFPVKSRGPELCIPVKLDQIPPILLDSVLLTEDNRFYTHSGIDIVSIYRAIISNVQAGRYAQGASTITQQLIRMTLLNPEKTLWRKFNEIILSLGADAIYSKNTILEAYLNRVYLGQAGPLPVLGVYEAARNFFGKSLDQLDASECALIAAIIRAPNILNPFRHPERTLARRNMILGLLLKHGKISRDTYEEETAKPIQMLRAVFSPPRASAFLQMAKQALRFGDSGGDSGRNFFATSMDVAMQAFVEIKMRRLGELGLQSYVIIVNPKTGSLLVYLTPASERWDGAGGNNGLFTSIATIPALTPQRANDPLYTLASQVTFDWPDARGMAFAEAFRLNPETLLSRISEVIGPEKIVSALEDFRVSANLTSESGIFIRPMTP